MTVTEPQSKVLYVYLHGVSNVGDKQEIASALWHALENLRSERIYTNGKILFECGQTSMGIYLVEEGEVRLCFPQPKESGETFELAGVGAILALSETLSGGKHPLRAEAKGQAQVAFVDRDQLLRFLKARPEFCMQIVRILSEDLHVLYHKAQQSRPAYRAGKSRRIPPDSASGSP